jgi:hypothetical protein
LSFEVILITYAAAKAFRDIVELVRFFRDLIRQATMELFEPWTSDFPDILGVDVIGLPAAGGSDSGEISAQGAPGSGALVPGAAIAMLGQRFRDVMLFGVLVVCLTFVAFVLWLVID